MSEAAPVVETAQQNTPPPNATQKEPQAPKDAPKAPAAQEERHEIKWNGKTKSVTTSELKRLAQLGETATERFETAAQKEKRADAIIKKAPENPIEALIDLGLTEEQIRDKMEAWYNKKFIEPETLTAEQRKIKEYEERLSKYEAEEKKKADAARREADQKADAEHTEHFQKQIIDAMEANKLPKTKTMVKKIAFYMRQSLANGWEAPMELIIQKVKEDRKNEDSEINEYSYDDIVDRFGEDFIKKVIAENLKRLRDKRSASGGASFSSKPVEPRQKDKGEYRSMDEVNRRLREMRLGK